MIQNKKIAIVGGGPGGLTLAVLLQQRGAHVTVYERDPGRNVRVQGATLDLHEESGLEALRRAGLLDAFYAAHRPDAGKLRVLDQWGVIHLDDHADENAREERPEIDRGPLRDLLLNALQPGTVEWDRRFVSMEKQQEGWLLHFENGTTATADLVIAADGAHSKIRPYLTKIRPVYSGVTVVEGTIYNAERNAPKLHALVNGGKIFALGDEQSLILSAKGDGSLSFYTGCKTPEHWGRDCGIDFSEKKQVEQWFRSAFAAWDESWTELFAGDEITFVLRPQYHFPLDQNWKAQPDLTMLGDAAHRMPPYAGEGVNMAMQDAYELAECLTSENFTDVKSAIAAFENAMRNRAAEVTRITLESTEMLHGRNAVENLLRLFKEVAQ